MRHLFQKSILSRLVTCVTRHSRTLQSCCGKIGNRAIVSGMEPVFRSTTAAEPLHSRISLDHILSRPSSLTVLSLPRLGNSALDSKSTFHISTHFDGPCLRAISQEITFPEHGVVEMGIPTPLPSNGIVIGDQVADGVTIGDVTSDAATLNLSSLLKKRHKKMNKHKYRKRRKRDLFKRRNLENTKKRKKRAKERKEEMRKDREARDMARL